jgi:hypothetical protein
VSSVGQKGQRGPSSNPMNDVREIERLERIINQLMEENARLRDDITRYRSDLMLTRYPNVTGPYPPFKITCGGTL